jgi:hypothetical protein
VVSCNKLKFAQSSFSDINPLSFFQMMYCSEDCRTRAYNSYHRTECRLSLNEPKHVDKWFRKTPALQNLDKEQLYQTKNVLRMSVRALLIGTEQGSQLENLMKTMTAKDIFKQNYDPSNKPYANDYICALGIMKIFDEPMFRMRRQISLAVRVIVELRHLHYSEPMQVHFNICRYRSLDL